MEYVFIIIKSFGVLIAGGGVLVTVRMIQVVKEYNKFYHEK